VKEGIQELDNGRLLIVVKLGGEGCVASHGGESIHVPAFPVDVVDTTGAGDSFNAGFLHAWLREKAPHKEEVQDCLRFAAACGGLSTRGLGGTAAQPDEDEVRRFLLMQAGVELAKIA
jgi:sugar/nucleoside kinase (ribokinase family)